MDYLPCFENLRKCDPGRRLAKRNCTEFHKLLQIPARPPFSNSHTAEPARFSSRAPSDYARIGLYQNKPAVFSHHETKFGPPSHHIAIVLCLAKMAELRRITTSTGVERPPYCRARKSAAAATPSSRSETRWKRLLMRNGALYVPACAMT
jgi:hypothetical protein